MHGQRTTVGLPSLTALANRHGSDKGTSGPSNTWSAHNYTDLYEAYLSGLRTLPIRLLEIGLGVDGPHWRSLIQHGRNSAGGASLKMWKDYFPNASIYGLDINPAEYLDDDRARTYVADQGKSEDLQQFIRDCEPGAFDIIIDDGSHNPRHQQVSLSVLFPYLRPGGVYFIEDLAANGFGDAARGGAGSNSVLNTRKVIKSFVETGAFGRPHALEDPTYLAEHIDVVHFHAPMPTLRYRLRSATSGRRRPLVSVLSYKRNSERLCAIRKCV